MKSTNENPGQPENQNPPDPRPSRLGAGKPVRSPVLPLIGVALGAGLLAFVVGRNTASGPPATGTGKAAHGEAGHEDHGEEGHEEHGKEKGHDEHGEEESRHDTEEIKFEGDAAREAGLQVAPVSFSLQSSGLPFNGQIEASPDR